MLGISDASGMFDIAGTMLMVYWLFVYGLKSIWLSLAGFQSDLFDDVSSQIGVRLGTAPILLSGLSGSCA